MEKYNGDILSQIKKLNDKTLTEVEKQEIEKKITEDKEKLNALIKEEKQQRLDERKQHYPPTTSPHQAKPASQYQ